MFSIRHSIILVFLLVTAATVQAAEWRECEKAKLRQLDLQQSARGDFDQRSGKQRKRSRNPDKARQDAENLETWLWKNCRNYSYELRNLEQDRM